VREDAGREDEEVGRPDRAADDGRDDRVDGERSPRAEVGSDMYFHLVLVAHVRVYFLCACSFVF
jgi:hypothetical protein